MATSTRDAGEIAVAFTRVLRGTGIQVPTSSTIAFGEALGVLGIDDRDATYWRVARRLVRRPEDHEVYDRAFRVFWEHAEANTVFAIEHEEEIQLVVDSDDEGDDADGPDEADADDGETIELRFSATEVLRQKDFADYSASELDEAQLLMSRLRLVGSPRRSLRLTAADRRTSRPDLRRTVRAAMRAHGEPVRRHFHEPSTRTTPGTAARRQRIDGAVRPRPHPLRARGGRRPPEGGGIRIGYAPDTCHPESSARATPTKRCAERRSPWPTTAAAPGSATDCVSSTTSGANAAWPAVRSS